MYVVTTTIVGLIDHGDFFQARITRTLDVLSVCIICKYLIRIVGVKYV